MLFNYKVIESTGQEKTGQIDAVSQDAAISSLQKRGFIVISAIPVGERSFLSKKLTFLDHVSNRALVIASRQLAALFEAQVSALKAFTLLGTTSDNKVLQNAMQSIAQDIQGGITISSAMEKHPRVFSDFYVNMVRAAEDSGKLVETFQYMADYLERQYELLSKTRNALVYPLFVIVTFIAVMVLMLTLVIPRLSAILIETGQDLPFYTRVVIGISDFFTGYGGIATLLVLIVLAGYFWISARSPRGRRRIDHWKLSMPLFGKLYQKLYLSRIADNMDTMLSAAIPVVRALEITGKVVDNEVYHEIMEEAVADVKSGLPISQSFEKHEPIPQIMVAMIRVGEETGTTGRILKTLARFYKRAVDGAIDTLIGLIEPIMIVALGIGVGFLLTSILIPIYNIASSF